MRKIDSVNHAPSDINYIEFLSMLHRRVQFDWYLEIGSERGESLAPARSNSISVDPKFKIKKNVINQKPSIFLFQQTSDEFFESKYLNLVGVKIDFTFVDGLHLIESTLRDFMNAEKHSSEHGVIAVHDCCPFNSRISMRDKAKAGTRAWTGDVWKILPILQAYRPDLRLTILGCRPTGLLLIDNLHPNSFELEMNFESIVDDWIDVTLDSYGFDKFYASFEYTACRDVIDNYFSHLIEEPRP